MADELVGEIDIYSSLAQTSFVRKIRGYHAQKPVICISRKCDLNCKEQTFWGGNSKGVPFYGLIDFIMLTSIRSQVSDGLIGFVWMTFWAIRILNSKTNLITRLTVWS